MSHTIISRSLYLTIAGVVFHSAALAQQPESTAPPAATSDQGVWTLDLEALALRASQSGLSQDSFDPGFRGSIGREFSDGLFTKMTFFSYSGVLYDDRSESPPYTLFDAHRDVELSSVEWVVGQHFTPAPKLALSPYAGLVWANFEEEIHDFGSYNIVGGGTTKFDYTLNADFSGLGIAVGIEGARALGDNLALYASAKESMVFGVRDYSEIYESGGLSDSDDRVTSITELGLGVQYDFSFSAIVAHLRGGVEGQYWTDLGIGNQGRVESIDTNFAGFVLDLNLRF